MIKHLVLAIVLSAAPVHKVVACAAQASRDLNLLDRAETIFVGTVTNYEPVWSDPRERYPSHTMVTFDVEHVLRGEPAETLTLVSKTTNESWQYLPKVMVAAARGGERFQNGKTVWSEPQRDAPLSIMLQSCTAEFVFYADETHIEWMTAVVRRLEGDPAGWQYSYPENFRPGGLPINWPSGGQPVSTP